MKQCVNCYAEIKDENDEKCPVCGKKLVVFEDMRENYQNFYFNVINEYPQVKKIMKLILIVSILFFVLPFLLFVAFFTILSIAM